MYRCDHAESAKGLSWPTASATLRPVNTSSLMQSAPGPETVIDGVRYLYFGGTSYLGLAGHPEVIEAGCAALREFGLHTATSRSRCGTSPPVLAVERRAAEFFGTEDAFYFASGYMGNHILVQALAADADAILVEEASHFCVREAARLVGLPVISFSNQAVERLASEADRWKRVLLLADAVGPVTGWAAPVAAYVQALRACERATVLLDDAHGFGVLGAEGRGLWEQEGAWAEVNGGGRAQQLRLCVTGTLAKALGGFGGVIPGTRQFVARARESSHYFDGASAPASPVAGATARALEIVLREPHLRTQLRDNARHLKAALRALGLEIPPGESAHFGVRLGSAEAMRRVHLELKQRGILLPHIETYAGLPPGGALRFAVFATHTRPQLDHLVSELRTLL